MKYNIKKAKIKGMTLEVEMEEIIFPENASPITNDVTKKSDQLIHEDLRGAFDKLRPHLISICEQKGATEIDKYGLDDLNNSFCEPYSITGFVIGGSDENEGVTLIGQRRISLGTLNLISPFTKYNGDYCYGDELAETIHACVSEVELYLFEGKCAVKQMELPFDEPENGLPEGMTASTGSVDELKESKKFKDMLKAV